MLRVKTVMRFGNRVGQLLVFILLTLLSSTLFSHGSESVLYQPNRHMKHRLLQSAIVTSDGLTDGFSVELLRAAAEAVGYTISFKVGPWHEIKKELTEKNIDVLPLVAFSKERDEVYDFTAPYLKMSETFFVRRGNTNITAIGDLHDKEVLIMKGDTAHEYALQEGLTDNLFLTNSYEEGFRLLASGQHDAILAQNVVGMQIIKELGLNNIVAMQDSTIVSLRPAALQLKGFEQNFCFAVAEGNQLLLAHLNEGLVILSINGTYETLYQKWFGHILPPQQHTRSQILTEIMYFVVPVVLIITLLFMIWFLKRKVATRTLGLQKEIQQRTIVEKELAEANVNYINAQKLGKVGNWSYDITTQTFNASTEAKRIFGFDNHSASFTIEAVENCILQKDPSHQALVDLIERGTPYNLEFDILKADTGEKRTVLSKAQLEYDAAACPVRVNGIIQDITEGRIAAAALQESERFLNKVGAIAKIGGWEHNLVTREAAWTKETFKIVELEPGPIPGPDEHLAYYLAKDRAILEREYDLTATTGKPFDLVLQCTTAKGRSIWVRIIGHPELVNGICVKMRGTIQDITYRVNVQKNLLQSQRLEALGVLARGIAHDFNNILSSILGFTELAKDNNPTNQQLQEDLHEINIAGIRARDLVQQIMTFSHNNSDAPHPVHLPAIVKDSIKLLAPVCIKRIEIKLEIDENVRPILADPTQLHQIIINLCTNAVQAMDDRDGTITINVSEVEVTETLRAEHPRLEPGSHVRFLVSDTGTGINPNIVGSIFDPYFTTKNLGDGTGLGLAVAYALVQNLEGSITVTSELGKGSCFDVYLPITDQNDTKKYAKPEYQKA